MARILVVDDRPEVVRAIARMLPDHETTTETDPRRALARVLGGEPYEIVLLDLEMPQMSGSEVSEAIDSAALARPPIVMMMSARENIDTLYATRRAVLIKPFDGNELRELVSAMLHETSATHHHC